MTLKNKWKQNDIEEQMEALSDTESIQEFTQGYCFSHGTVAFVECCEEILLFFSLLTHSYCADWKILTEDYGLISNKPLVHYLKWSSFVFSVQIYSRMRADLSLA